MRPQNSATRSSLQIGEPGELHSRFSSVQVEREPLEAIWPPAETGPYRHRWVCSLPTEHPRFGMLSPTPGWAPEYDRTEPVSIASRYVAVETPKLPKSQRCDS